MTSMLASALPFVAAISITAIIGVILAVIILVILVNMAIKAFERFVYPPDPLLIYIIWGLVTILCIFLLAYAFGIPIPFFTW